MPSRYVYLMVLFKNVKIEPRQKMVKIDCSTGPDGKYFHRLRPQLAAAALEDYNFSGHSKETKTRASIFSVAIIWDLRWPSDLGSVSLASMPDDLCMDQVLGGASRGAMDVIEVKYAITG